MLRSLKDLEGYSIRATDGVIGDVREFLFDAHLWKVRYLVADTGAWLPGRLVLISPASLGQADWSARWLPVNLTVDQVENSPDIDADQPVSRRHEMHLHDHYGWPYYWEENKEDIAPADDSPSGRTLKGDPNLHSTREVLGYHVHAIDGRVGHIDDFIADDEAWMIRYLAIDTRNWLPGRKVLVAPEWARAVNWAKAEVVIDLTRVTIRHCPEFDPSQPVNREYEERLFDYYGRPAYWE